MSDLEKITGVHRRNIYESLSRLSDHRFVSAYLENDIKYFQIVSVDLIEAKLRQKSQSIDSFISRLKKIKKEAAAPHVHVLSGNRGVKMLLDDELKSGEPVYGIASSGFEKVLWDYLDSTPHKLVKQGPPVYLIYTESDRENMRGAIEHGYAEVRVVPDEYKSAIGLEMYGDTSAILLEHFIIKIKDNEVTQRFKMFFDTLWKISKKPRIRK
jgi:sugar-specific transcriptional regulator TrmB